MPRFCSSEAMDGVCQLYEQSLKVEPRSLKITYLITSYESTDCSDSKSCLFLCGFCFAKGCFLSSQVCSVILMSISFMLTSHLGIFFNSTAPFPYNDRFLYVETSLIVISAPHFLVRQLDLPTSTFKDLQGHQLAIISLGTFRQ